MASREFIRRTILVAGVALVAARPQLIGFLGKWESGKERVLVVYRDKLAGDMPTVFNGLTRHVTSTPIVVGEVWSNEKCEAEKAGAVMRVTLHVRPAMRPPCSQPPISI